MLYTEGNKSTYVVAFEMLFLTTSTIRNGVSEVNMADGMKRDWRELCLAVTNESDSTKLGSLVQQLIEALDAGERSWRQLTQSPDVQNARQRSGGLL